MAITPYNGLVDPYSIYSGNSVDDIENMKRYAEMMQQQQRFQQLDQLAAQQTYPYMYTQPYTYTYGSTSVSPEPPVSMQDAMHEALKPKFDEKRGKVIANFMERFYESDMERQW